MHAGFYYICIMSSIISLRNMEEEKEKDDGCGLT